MIGDKVFFSDSRHYVHVLEGWGLSYFFHGKIEMMCSKNHLIHTQSNYIVHIHIIVFYSNNL